jgi:methyltransferase (TIGR00027 family)
MTGSAVEQKPSETALFAALRRALAHKEYQNQQFGPDNLADCFLPPHFRFFLKFKKIRANTKEKLNSFLPGLNEYMIARTAYFDGLFMDALQQATPQIVLLGAGYDSRAYRFARQNQGTKIFELDIAPTQNRKVQCLKQARIDIPADVKFVSINFNQKSLKDVLERAGYNQNQKTFFSWEGVSYYLDAVSVDNTLAFVSQQAHPDSTIAFDYTITLTDQNKDTYYGAEKFAQTMREAHGDEQLTFSIAETDIEPFLASRDLKLVEHLEDQQIEQRFLTDQAGKLIGQMTAHFRFALAAPSTRRVSKQNL